MTLKTTINRQFETLSGELLAIDYILERILANADEYQAVIDYQHDSSGAVLFSLLYWLTIRQLKAGNTLFWLSDTGKPDEMGVLQVLNAPVWQQKLLGYVWQELDACLDGYEQASDTFVPDFVACANAFASQTPNEMKQAVETYLAGLSHQLQIAGVPSYYVKFTAQLVRLALRLCFVVIKEKLDTLAKLHEYLLCTPFFALAHTTSSSTPRPLVLSGLGALGEHNSDTAEFGVWLYRSYRAEAELVRHIQRLHSASQEALPTLDKDGLNPEQANAIITALTHHFSIITGGPGTGKTTTVARLVLALLQRQAQTGEPMPTLALSAPTGKAAQRMQESLQFNIAKITKEHPTKFTGQTIALPEAMTIHRLLGMGMDGIPRYHADNPLPFEMIIVDEASMLGVELSQKLFSAVKTGSRLILLGDNHQLSAVEAGMVLGDLCHLKPLASCHQTLIESRRFSKDSGVGKLASLVNQMPPPPLQDIHALIHLDKYLSLTTPLKGNYEPLITPYQVYFEKCRKFFNRVPSDDDKVALFEALNQYRILCASHRGEFGDEMLNLKISQAHFAKDRPTLYVPTWYHGRVVMITKNHYNLGLFNGDMGICLKQPDGFVVYFDGKPTPIATTLLPDESVVSAYAITIHKSQGSEFEHVAICLDGHSERLLSKELLYTAITRAKEQVSLYADDETLLVALQNPTVRNTGLELLYQAMDE